MNKITYAGKMEGITSKRAGNCFTVIIPTENSVGTIVWTNNGVENNIAFNAGSVIAVPPMLNCNISVKSPAKTICIIIERALLPFKDITSVTDDPNSGILHAAQQAETYFNGDYYKKEPVLSALGNLLVSYLTAFAADDGFSPVTKQIRAEIEKNISNTAYSLENYIRALPLNYDYVRKVFKKEVGATPHEYLMQQRMELAANLLAGGISNRYSPYSVSQVAEACGFSEPLYFSKVFKKYYGIAPGSYVK